MSHDGWPELPWRTWGDSLATLHMWTQIVGKLRMAATPPASHWGHAPLSVTPRGLTTSAVPYGTCLFQIDLDLVDHALLVADSDGRSGRLELAEKPVADFYRELLAALASLDIELSILARPVEVADAIPFDEDYTHATYDREHVRAFHGALVQAQRLLARFQADFVGKTSPVQFFWGSFDLTTERFSGRRAPTHPGGAPNVANWVMEEAYSHELSSAGWWATHPELGPAFFAYTYPEPPGLAAAAVRPASAFYHPELKEFILRYDDVRLLADPEAEVIAFFEDCYARGAELGDWPRSALESTNYPVGPPREPWSTNTTALGPVPHVSGGFAPDP
jgi:hypothetical protein